MTALPGKPRILMVTPRYLPETGGIETHVHEVGTRLALNGHFVEILTTDRSHALPASEAICPGMKVKRLPAWPKKHDYYWAPALNRAIMSAKCDVIHVQGYHTFVAPIAMMAALRKQVPYVLTFHSGGHSSHIRRYLRKPQWLALCPLVQRASHCVGVSQYEADLFSAFMRVPRDRFTVIPNGGELATVAAPAQIENEPLIVSIGRLERYKGHQRLVEAFPEILRNIPGARVRILGEGPYKETLLALVDRLGLQRQVHIGGIPLAERAQLGMVLGAAGLVVLLSDYEAHPVAVVEALALGRRVLVTDCSGFREMVDNDAVAAVPRHANSKQIAAAVIERLGKGPLTRTFQLPTWDSCAERLTEVYQGVLQ